MFCKNPRKPIAIFNGDDTNFEGNRNLYFEIESLDALNPAKIEFSFLGIKRTFTTLPADGRFEVSFSHEETAKFPLGTSFATLTAIDSDNRERTLDNRIAIFVTNNVALAYCGDDDKLISIKIGTINADIVPPDAEAQTGEAADAKATYEALEDKATKAELGDLDERVTELEENGGSGSSVEVVAPDSSARAGQAADAKETYEALNAKRSLDDLNYTRNETYLEPGYVLEIYNLDKTELLKTVNLKLISERHSGAFVTKVWEYRTDNTQYQLTGEWAGYDSYDWRFIASDEYGIFFAPTWHTSLLDGLETDHTVTGTNCVYELQYSESIEVTKPVDDKLALVSQIPDIEIVTPSSDGAGKAADAKATYEALENRATKGELEAEVERAKEAEEGLDERITELENGESGVAELMVETTHADLMSVRNSGGLIPGMQYRITDYVATTVQEHTQSANHPFDIIVTADSPDKLNEVARAIRHEGDTYFPETTKFEAWKIWYSLDNDTNRFEWADSSNGKGVIYRMIDEFNNDVPYDFKGIKMQAYLGYNEEAGDDEFSEDYRYTFGVSKDDSMQLSVIDEVVYGSYLNNIGPYYKYIFDGDWMLTSVKLSINFITFGSGCYNNTFDSGCYYNTFGSGCYNNTFGSGCGANIIYEFFSAITIQNNVYENTIDCTQDRGDYEYCQNIEIKSGVAGEVINIDDVYQTYHTEIRPENSITITV